MFILVLICVGFGFLIGFGGGFYIGSTNKQTKKKIAKKEGISESYVVKQTEVSQCANENVILEPGKLFCKYCGKQVDKNSIFCKYCGKKQS